jgi:hypothetical protein
VHISWSRPVSTGGAHVTAYRAIARAVPGQHGPRTPKRVVLSRSAAKRSALLRGLQGGWIYRVFVRAVNRHGQGPAGKPRNDDFFVHQPV